MEAIKEIEKDKMTKGLCKGLANCIELYNHNMILRKPALLG